MPKRVALYLLPTLLFLTAFTYIPMIYTLVEGWSSPPSVLQHPDTRGER
jgi:ABC-type sugar transport system permease subunit